MEAKYRKIRQLKEMGWTKEDFVELLRELGEALSEENVKIESREEIATKLLRDLGFSFKQVGTKYLREILLYCVEKETTEIPLKKELYLFITEKYQSEYERIRWNIREAIYKAFDEPTPLAQEIFEVSLLKRGYPTIKEFIAEACDYFQVVLS